jgi:hypothetical protein
MTGIRDLLADVAAEAPPYDVTNQALRTARRQRRIAWTAPFVAVVLVVAAAAWQWPSATTIHQSAPAVPWLPARLAPEESPALLSGGPVGPAALAYTRDDGSTTLVTEDGRHYDAGPVHDLSPNGRWVVVMRGERLTLRDLTGTATRDLGLQGEVSVAAWSPDSRWMATRSGPAQRVTTVIDLATGQAAATMPAGSFGNASVCGLRDSTYLVLCRSDGSTAVSDLWVVDPTTGRELSHSTVPIPDPPGATAISRSSQLMPDLHSQARWTTYKTDQGLRMSGDAVLFDLDQPAAPVRRHPLPALAETMTRTIASTVDGGLILVRAAPAAPQNHVIGLDLFSLETGKLSEITTVTGDIRGILVRGAS